MATERGINEIRRDFLALALRLKELTREVRDHQELRDMRLGLAVLGTAVDYLVRQTPSPSEQGMHDALLAGLNAYNECALALDLPHLVIEVETTKP